MERQAAARVLTDEEAGALDERVRRGEELPPEDRRCWLAYHAARGGRPRPPRTFRRWSPREDELVRTLPVDEAAWRTGRTPAAVYERRRELGVAGRSRRG